MATSFDVELVPIPSGPPPSGAVANAEPFPLTCLEYLRERIGYSPYLFWGLSNEAVIHSSQCNSVIYEYAWQAADQVGRSAMRDYLYDAEQDLLRELKFSVAPHFVEETLAYLQLQQVAQNNIYNWSQYGAGDALGRWTSVQLKEGYVRAVGVESLTLIDTVAISITDENNDDLYDTFTATVSTMETDLSKLAVYFASTDRLDNEGASERWRIQPVNIAIASGVATITGRVWTIVKPILYEKATQQLPLDPDDLTVFISTVSVYIRTTNPNGTQITDAMAEMIWETTPFPSSPYICCGSDSSFYSTDPATQGFATGRVGIRDAKLGIVTPAQGAYNSETGLWNSNFSCWGYRPDRVTIRYNAGYPLDSNGQVSKMLRSATVDLAIASMPNRLCACDVANKVLHELQFDMAHTASGVEMYSTTRQQLNNVFGTKRGEISAWRRVQKLALHRGVKY